MLTEDELKLKEALETIIPIVDRLLDAGYINDFVPETLADIISGAEDFLSYAKEHEKPENQWASYPQPTGASDEKPETKPKRIKLIDYLDNPELIRHINGHHVISIAYNKRGYNDPWPVVVKYKLANRKGQYSISRYPEESEKFVLINPGTRVVGWRRKVLFKNGNIMATALFMPTKEAFSAAWKGYKTFGEWEKIDEIIEE